MKTETWIVIGGVIGGVIALVIGSSKAAPAKTGTDYPGPWKPGVFQSKIKVGDRLIVKFQNPGTNRGYGVLFVPQASDTLELTSSKISGPTQAIFTGKNVGTVAVTISMIDTTEMIQKPLVLNGVPQTMALSVSVEV